MNQNPNNQNMDATGNGAPPVLTQASRNNIVIFASIAMALCAMMNIPGALASDRSAQPIIMSLIMSVLLGVISGGMTVMLMHNAPKLVWIPALIPLIPFIIFTAAKPEKLVLAVIGLLLSLYPIVSGMSMYIAMRKKISRTGTIIVSAACTGSYTALILLFYAYFCGMISSDSSLSDMISSARNALIGIMNESNEMLTETMGYTLGAEDIELVVNEFFNILPSTVLIIFLGSSFFTHLSFLALSQICGLLGTLPTSYTEFKVSRIGAVIFIASYALSAFADASSPIYAVAVNISSLLLYPLALVGFTGVLPRRTGNIVRVGCFPLGTVMLLLVFAPFLAIPVLAFVGAWSSLKKEKK